MKKPLMKGFLFFCSFFPEKRTKTLALNCHFLLAQKVTMLRHARLILVLKFSNQSALCHKVVLGQQKVTIILAT